MFLTSAQTGQLRHSIDAIVAALPESARGELSVPIAIARALVPASEGRREPRPGSGRTWRTVAAERRETELFRLCVYDRDRPSLRRHVHVTGWSNLSRETGLAVSTLRNMMSRGRGKVVLRDVSTLSPMEGADRWVVEVERTRDYASRPDDSGVSHLVGCLGSARRVFVPPYDSHAGFANAS